MTTSPATTSLNALPTNLGIFNSCLNLLTHKRREWSDALLGDDPNSVQSQINVLVFDFVSFLVINRARDVAPKDTDGEPKISPLLHGLLNRAFIEITMVRIRKLTEIRQLNPRKAIHSLIALLEDMRDHKHLLTRQNILHVESLSYDVPSFGFTHEQAMPDCRQESIDRLTGTSAASRLPGDHIAIDWFEAVIKRVSKRSSNVKNFVDKFVAHAATPTSRQAVNPQEMRVHLARLWQTTALICKVAHQVRVDILGGNAFSPLGPYPPCEFAYILGEPANADQIGELQNFWGRLEEKVGRWFGCRRCRRGGGGMFDWFESQNRR